MTESQRKKFPNVFGDSPITKNGRNMVLLKIGRKHPTGHNDTSYVVIGAKMNFLRNSIRANSEKRKTLLLPPLKLSYLGVYSLAYNRFFTKRQGFQKDRVHSNHKVLHIEVFGPIRVPSGQGLSDNIHQELKRNNSH